MMAPAFKSFIHRWLINTLAVLVAASVVRGISYDSFTGLAVASLLLGILNSFVRPIMMLLSLPLLLFTLGLFTLVINALLLYWVGQLKSFHVESFSAAFWGALIISIVSMFLNTLTGVKGSKVELRRKKSTPPPRGDDGGGPVIDV